MDHLGYVLHLHFIQRKQIYFFRAACMMERTKYLRYNGQLKLNKTIIEE